MQSELVRKRLHCVALRVARSHVDDEDAGGGSERVQPPDEDVEGLAFSARHDAFDAPTRLASVSASARARVGHRRIR